jgi:hypothetical protein
MAAGRVARFSTAPSGDHLGDVCGGDLPPQEQPNQCLGRSLEALVRPPTARPRAHPEQPGQPDLGKAELVEGGAEFPAGHWSLSRCAFSHRRQSFEPCVVLGVTVIVVSSVLQGLIAPREPH